MAKNIVIGVGNLLFCDDGIGIIVSHYLEKNFTFEPALEILDGGTLGFNLIEYFTDYDNVLIVDTISLNAQAGEIFKIPSSELLGQGSYKSTAHEVEVVQMLEACELYDKKADITILGIVPKDIHSTKIGLSEGLTASFDLLIESVTNYVKELGTIATRKDNFCLEEIIKELRC